MDVIAKANKSAEAEKLKIDTFDITTYTDDEITNLEIELGKLEGELENPSESLKAELKAKMDKKKEDEAELKKFEDELTAIDQKVNLHQKNIERVAELKEEEKSLACQIAELEGQEFLTEEFIRTKVNLFDEKINSKFKLAKFKMFNTLVNGALDETCECTFKGVPFSSINSAAKINVGLDIINVLSEHYGLKTPIFVDNAESVTRLNTIDCQTIATYVLDKDAELPKAVGNIIRMEDLK